MSLGIREPHFDVSASVWNDVDGLILFPDCFGVRLEIVATLEMLDGLCASNADNIYDPVIPVEPRTSVDAMIDLRLNVFVECLSTNRM